jgi:hypothetical protein
MLTKNILNIDKFRIIFLKIYIIELIFCGPLGIIVNEISIRKFILFAVILSSLLSLKKRNFEKWYIVLCLVIIIIFLCWGALIPEIKGIDLNLSFKETNPLAILMLAYGFSIAIQNEGVKIYLVIANYCLKIVAIIIVFAWGFILLQDNTSIAYGVQEYFFKISGSNFGLYIGPMPDGSFRIMWITCMLFPFFLIYINRNSINLSWSLIYIIAIYATGTRSFIYSSIIIIIYFGIRYSIIVTTIAMLFLVIVISNYFEYLDHIRVFEIKEEFQIDSPRYEQFYSLLKLFLQNPLLGSGFGSNAEIIRSSEAPFSYELTYMALLAKVGIIGSFIMIIISIILINKYITKYNQYKYVLFLCIINFILITSTNPYLMNFIGLTIISLWIAVSLTKKF